MENILDRACYIEKLTEICIEFSDGEKCAIEKIRNCDVNLNKTSFNSVFIRCNVFYPIIKKKYENRINLKKIVFIFNCALLDDIFKKLNDVYFEYNTDAAIDNFKIDFSGGIMEFELIGDFYV